MNQEVDSAVGSSVADKMPWWRRGLVYQVYVRSFADANGDGTGDINGLRARLPYLRDLGVDALWINPWYLSPLADGGYDVADYRAIEPRYGTLADAEALIAEAHQHGIRILADLVPNHTSDQHAWFAEAIASPIGHPSRARYHMQDGRGPNGERPPTNWQSVFGGPAWHRLPDGQWYLHLFAPEQPDLNWHNPEVRAEFESVLRFWLDRDIDGFRVDVAHGLMKDMGYPDLDNAATRMLASTKQANHSFWDRDELHEVVRSWRAVLDDYPGDRMMVAEAWVRPERLPLYLRPDEYHQSFNFDLLEANWDAVEMREVIDAATKAAANVGSTPTWVLSNHDVMRATTRYGLPKATDWRTWPSTGPASALDVAAGARRARAAALLLLALPGSAYIYQGEELGLPEVWDLPDEVLDDPVWERSGHTMRGRDGCRVPLPWDTTSLSAGFSTGLGWLPQPADWSHRSAAAQQGQPDSSLELFRSAIALRRQLGVLDEQLDWLMVNETTIAFRRASGLTCVVNFGSEPIELPEHRQVLLASVTQAHPTRLEPDAAVWLR
jgi:alpha-glucosidase